MSHYTVKFTGTHADKLTQAFHATVDYLGDDRTTKIATDIVNTTKDCRKIIRWCRMVCMMEGIQGYYPVHAFTLYVLKQR